eukprot:6058660-Pyramimonas_sp.AAC.1
MGYDQLSPMLYTYNKDEDGNLTGVQSATLLGNGFTSNVFKKNVAGMWFTQQSEEIRNCRGVHACNACICSSRNAKARVVTYEEEPYPTDEEMAEIATRVNAPSVAQVRINGPGSNSTLHQLTLS